MLAELLANMEQRMTDRLQACMKELSIEQEERLGKRIKKLGKHWEKRRKEQRMKRAAVMMNAECLKQFAALAEGHPTATDNSILLARVDAIEDDVKVLKIAVRQTNTDISELKKPQ